jgi:hypothetical protein
VLFPVFSMMVPLFDALQLLMMVCCLLRGSCFVFRVFNTTIPVAGYAVKFGGEGLDELAEGGWLRKDDRMLLVCRVRVRLYRDLLFLLKRLMLIITRIVDHVNVGSIVVPTYRGTRWLLLCPLLMKSICACLRHET